MCVSVWVFVTCVKMPKELTGNIRSPRDGVNGDCELTNVVVRNWPLLFEQQILFTTEPLLTPCPLSPGKGFILAETLQM